MNKKQILILIFSILALLGLTFFVYFKVKESKARYLYLYTGDYNIVRWYYNDNTWYYANTNEKMDDTFDVYLNGKYYGNYSLVFNDKWYYFDSNKNSKKLIGANFMINTNYEFNSYEFSLDNANDKSLVSNVSKEIGIDNNEYSGNLKKYKIYNNDKIDNIYFIDYYQKQTIYNALGPSYTVAFMVQNGKINIIEDLAFDETAEESCSLSLVGVFNFENNNNKILLNCIHFDQIPSDYYLYEYSFNKIKLLIEGKGGV